MAKLFLIYYFNLFLIFRCRFSDNKYWPKVRTLPKEGNLAHFGS